MLNLEPGRRIWLCTRATDMRRSFDGLSAQVRNDLDSDPTDGQLYVFVNRRQTMLKILGFDGDGYWVYAKRLEQGQFAGRRGDRRDKVSLSRTALLALIDGADIVVKRQRKRYRNAA